MFRLTKVLNVPEEVFNKILYPHDEVRKPYPHVTLFFLSLSWVILAHIYTKHFPYLLSSVII